MELYNGQLKNYPFKTVKKRSHHKQKDGKSATTIYSESIITFDIEVTSAWLENGKVIPYTKGKDAEYWNSLQPIALCYIWQFSCDGVVYYGRELKDFENVLNDLPSNIQFIIWVHNLSYEFQFLRNIVEWKSVFAKSPHKPIKAVPLKYENIEFRCSYMLTRLKLESWGKQLGLPKMVGDLDYEKMRTPYTELTEAEMGYCERDCLVVEKGIQDYVRRYGLQKDIPLTQTGTVRKVVKDKLMSDYDYCRYIKKLVPRDASQYRLFRDIFAGGYTHANRFYSGKIITGHIEHYDFSSSYPTVMVCEKMPSTPFVYVGSTFPNESTFEDMAYIFHLRFTNLRCVTFNTYIQYAKAKGENFELDNGRVMSASVLELNCTELDYLTIKESYKWDSVECIRVYRSFKNYLPKDFISYVLELYGNKTTLKNVAGYEDLYMQSKSYINALFGMSCTAIIQSNVKLEGDEWIIEPLTEEYVNKKLDALRNGNIRDKRYFLNYAWGCWITAYARRNLWKCIIPNDYNVLYVDTDSIFLNGTGNFDWYNKEIINKLERACDDLGIDRNLIRPKTPKGIETPLGIFTREEDCVEFCTLGAKRYVERRDDEKLYLTVSGINKEAVELLEDDISNFKDGFDFNKDADCVSKRLSTYCNNMPKCTFDDGYKFNYKYGINLRRCGYLLTMTDEYKELIEYLDTPVKLLPEHIIQRIKAMF